MIVAKITESGGYTFLSSLKHHKRVEKDPFLLVHSKPRLKSSPTPANIHYLAISSPAPRPAQLFVNIKPHVVFHKVPLILCFESRVSIDPARFQTFQNPTYSFLAREHNNVLGLKLVAPHAFERAKSLAAFGRQIYNLIGGVKVETISVVTV